MITRHYFTNDCLMNKKFLLVAIAGIMIISLTTFASAQTSEIPSWVKNVEGFWSEDAITDKEFLAAIKYLIDNNVLKVSSVTIPSSEVVPEKSKNPQLSANVDLITFKLVQLQELASNLL